MPRSGITISNQVNARDDFGRFLSNLDGAAERTASQTVDVGVRVSRASAPVKSGLLSRSFYKQMMGHSGIYYNTAPYAKFQDEGAGPNEKPADVSFFWADQGRFWNPDKTGMQVIRHPGNPATHFMLDGWEAMRAAAPGIMRRNYG